MMHQMMLAAGGEVIPLAVDAISNGGAGGGGGGQDVTSISWNHTCSGSNRALIVAVGFNTFGGISISSVTYNSVAMTDIGGITNGSSRRSQLFKLSNPTSGDHVVQVNFSGTCSNAGGTSVSFTGAHQTTASLTGTLATATGASSTPPSISVSSGSGQIVIDNLVHHPLEVVSQGSGQTLQDLSGDGGAYENNVSTEPGAASVTMSWTIESEGGNWSLAGVSVKPP